MDFFFYELIIDFIFINGYKIRQYLFKVIINMEIIKMEIITSSFVFIT